MVSQVLRNKKTGKKERGGESRKTAGTTPFFLFLKKKQQCTFTSILARASLQEKKKGHTTPTTHTCRSDQTTMTVLT